MFMMCSQSHKYVLEATVMNNTWPISDSAWNFVTAQKSAEKLDGSEWPPT